MIKTQIIVIIVIVIIIIISPHFLLVSMGTKIIDCFMV